MPQTQRSSADGEASVTGYYKKRTGIDPIVRHLTGNSSRKATQKLSQIGVEKGKDMKIFP
jgi:hypothetical protein